MNIVDQVARIIDPDAFDETPWYDGVGPDAKKVDFGPVEKSRKEFHKSQAIVKAGKILKLVLKTKNIREQLIEDERNGWEKLGIPASILNTPEVQKVIEDKYKE